MQDVPPPQGRGEELHKRNENKSHLYGESHSSLHRSIATLKIKAPIISTKNFKKSNLLPKTTKIKPTGAKKPLKEKEEMWA